MENEKPEIKEDQYWLFEDGGVVLTTEYIESGSCWLVNGVDCNGNVIDGRGVGEQYFKKLIDGTDAKTTAMSLLEKKAIELLKL